MASELDSIGFYTLTDDRCRNASVSSPLWRAELLLTSGCNLRCAYCRGVRPECSGTMPTAAALRVLDSWIANGLRNVRFSGGEPTLYPDLVQLVERCRAAGVRRIAVSTNGTAEPGAYERLLAAGVDDWSISLDSCCESTNDALAGVPGTLARVCETLRLLSRSAYVTVGVVVTDANTPDVTGTLWLAHNLGVADVRLIPAAGVGRVPLDTISDELLAAHPILRYRVDNLRRGVSVRGLTETDSRRCPLALDDVHVSGAWHFPCVIYFREGGEPIGRWDDPAWRRHRERWALDHDTHADPICRGQCLDVCRHYNNRRGELVGATCPTTEIVREKR